MRKTELQINLRNLEHNLSVIKSKTTSAIQAVVKANLYGLQLKQIIEILDSQVESYAVITLDEARDLRKLTKLPILLLQGVHENEDYKTVSEQELDFVLHSSWQIKSIDKFKLASNRLWLKVNTGMNRLGFSEQEFLENYNLMNSKNFRDIVVMSHLASSSDILNQQNQSQINTFDKITDGISNKKSLANSGALFNYPESHYDIVRTGIALYGGKYQEFGIKSISCLRSKIISIKKISRGETVGYDGMWRAKQDTHIAAIGIGYGDGFPYFSESFSVNINGNLYKTVGKINMDLITIDIGNEKKIKVGDWVELWGYETNLTELSQKFNSISYQLLTNISRRVAKNYLE
ncbi:MAG: alanine racemase [SAR86 cluster bacterium]|uniref:Alanine racemase n=1 Tax=SAR86 cluster bacterium TaxID=2030880 RepID=A0A937IBD9_9GAMM|nr:alanine racemase [SAR86 cluster bacterium]